MKTMDVCRQIMHSPPNYIVSAHSLRPLVLQWKDTRYTQNFQIDITNQKTEHSYWSETLPTGTHAIVDELFFSMFHCMYTNMF